MYAFDIEVFPNFFSVIFIHVDDELDDYFFILSDKQNDIDSLKQFLSIPRILVGYNNLHFDNVILNAALEGSNNSKLFELGQKIIVGQLDNEVNRLKYQKVNYQSIDIMQLMAFDQIGIGLKQVSISLKWPRVQELPFDPEQPLTDDQIETVLDYNMNDVLITKALFNFELLDKKVRVRDLVEMRRAIGAEYGVDLINASDSRMANLILAKIYVQRTGKDPKNLRTQRIHVEPKKCVGKHITFKSDELNYLLDQILSKDLTQQTSFKLKEEVRLGGLIFDVGVGGLHSRDDARVFIQTDDHLIIDADVSSFYPRIMILNQIKPQHLGKEFLEIFERITQERLEAKKNNKAKAEALKITINSIFGKLRNEHFWLFDPQAFYSVTISGQLYLLMLIENLILNGFEVLSANTDGVVTQVERCREKEYYQVCQNWSIQTTFELEYTPYLKYIRRDVNNYITQKEDNKLKKKGIFETDINLNKGYWSPIIPKALEGYFIYGVPITETVHGSEDIHDFMMFQKIGRKFKLEFDYEPVQRVSRFYACLNGGFLEKVDDTGRRIGLCTGTPVKVANDVKGPFKNYKVNLHYYIAEIDKIISKIEPSCQQLMLF